MQNSNAHPPTIISIVWSDIISFEEVAPFVHDDVDFGIYQIYGSHPVHGKNVLLYIGRAMKGSFGWRVLQHRGRLQEENASELTVRLGRLAGAETPAETIWNQHIEFAELLLIAAHQPPLNRRLTLGDRDVELQYVHVCNWNERGDLLPEVSGLRWTTVGASLPKNIYSVQNLQSTAVA